MFWLVHCLFVFLSNLCGCKTRLRLEFLIRKILQNLKLLNYRETTTPFFFIITRWICLSPQDGIIQLEAKLRELCALFVKHAIDSFSGRLKFIIKSIHLYITSLKEQSSYSANRGVHKMLEKIKSSIGV
ncbi:uncharacterized protein [Spinacia oleracea]|uniref:Secreted protein n=1 Tax=Spinacia oleracea TaxID=3562 RepID=A0A9R0JIP0_SPIOL|nr:uncharacterized protein LOC110775620 [Spinacia oleracea]